MELGGGKSNHEAMLRGGGGDVVEEEDEPVATTEEAAAAEVTAVNTSFTSMSSDDRLLMSKVFSRSGASCVLTMGIRPRSDSCLITARVCCLTDTDIVRKRHRKMAAVVANDPFIILWHPL